MTDLTIAQVFATPDGKQFATRAEAQDHMRRPVIKAALATVVEDNEDLVDWLIDNRTEVADAFQAGTIKRVSKSEKNQLEKALKAIVEADEPKFKFIKDNHEAILETFRWPTVKRMSDEEKAAEVKTELTALADGNEEVADFVIEQKDAILGAYDAGKVKREINPKAREGLAAWQAEQKAKKEAEKAAATAKPAPKKK